MQRLELAYEITKIFYCLKNAEKARDNWKSNFENNELTGENKVVKVSNGDNLLRYTRMNNVETITSSSSAKRMIKNGAVYINDKKVEDVKYVIRIR